MPDTVSDKASLWCEYTCWYVTSKGSDWLSKLWELVRAASFKIAGEPWWQSAADHVHAGHCVAPGRSSWPCRVGKVIEQPREQPWWGQDACNTAGALRPRHCPRSDVSLFCCRHESQAKLPHLQSALIDIVDVSVEITRATLICNPVCPLTACLMPGMTELTTLAR